MLNQLLLACCVTMGAESAADPPASAILLAPPAASAVNAPQPSGRAGFRPLKRARLGLTSRNVVRVLRTMKEAGELGAFVATDPETGEKAVNTSALALAVAGKLADQRPQVYGDLSAWDWDQIIQALEQLLELLAKWLPIIIDLFSDVEEPVAFAPPGAPCAPAPPYVLAA